MKRLIQGTKADLGLLREWFFDWLEYQEAKEWANFYHPGWLQIARKAPGRITRKVYREKILRAYRGEWDG